MNVLLEEFDLLLDAPGSVPKLRELILDLAVRGKLVEQDPEDEPASVLLERIEKEKRRLYMEGRVPKPKQLRPHAPGDEPHPVPASWTWTRLGNVGAIVGGGTPKSKVAQYWADEGVPWLTPADLNGHASKTIGRGRRDISQLGLEAVAKVGS